MAKNINTSGTALSRVGGKTYGQNVLGVPGYFDNSDTIILSPTGDDTYADDSGYLQEAIDYIAANGKGAVLLNPGLYYAKDVTLKSGVSIRCLSLPMFNQEAVCPDLGLDPVSPFVGGAGFVGLAGNEKVFLCNTTDLSEPLDDTYRADDVAVSGVVLENLWAFGIDSLLDSGGANHLGISFSVLRNLFGADINGIFLNLVNPQHVHGSNIKGFNAKHLLRIGAYHAACQLGNSYFEDLYNYAKIEGEGIYTGENPDWCIKLDTRSAGATVGGGQLNYVHLAGRIQVNGFHGSLDRARGNAAIVVEGATAELPVNSCTIKGMDIEGNWTYGLKVENATSLDMSVDGFSSLTSFVAGIKLIESLQCSLHSNSFNTSVHSQGSSCHLSGYVKYFAYDENDTGHEFSEYCRGIYFVQQQYNYPTNPPTYSNINQNGVFRICPGMSNSYYLDLSDSENVLRSTLIPFATSINEQSGNKTWQRWEASTVLISGTASVQTLPVIDAKMNGVEFKFKAIQNNHTIQGQSGQQIDGAASYALLAGATVKLLAVTNGTKWVVVGD